ncbi:unnamed protein product [Paramecium sonneborni]|uniref:Uncharacterized protein n=1 Tax=Paramecium sonneborni TaxID=65129 RepID=A0A8S1MW84_9CILI|nr:unnamed protein product [Paramecium sonneborni]
MTILHPKKYSSLQTLCQNTIKIKELAGQIYISYLMKSEYHKKRLNISM